MIEAKPTHEPRPTMLRAEVSAAALELWEQLYTTLRSEEAWYIIETALRKIHDSWRFTIEVVREEVRSLRIDVAHEEALRENDKRLRVAYPVYFQMPQYKQAIGALLADNPGRETTLTFTLKAFYSDRMLSSGVERSELEKWITMEFRSQLQRMLAGELLPLRTEDLPQRPR